MNNPSPLDLAVHTALALRNSASSIALARWRAANPMGAALDAKRPQAWCEYGYPERIETDDLYRAYSRGSIAHGAVRKLVQRCWSTSPWWVDRDVDADSDRPSPWESRTRKTTGTAFWRAVRDADRRRLACRWSAVLLRLADGQQWDQPVKRSQQLQLVELLPVWPSALTPKEYDAEGHVTEWTYNEERIGSANVVQRTLHADRVFVFGDPSANAVGFLDPAYNDLINLEKIGGGTGESFLKNAARQMHVNFDAELDLRSVADMYGVTVEDLQKRYNDAARDINRGNDVMLITQGATATPMTTVMPDPKSPHETALANIACALDIPMKILVGMQTGERASTEDEKSFSRRCQSRRTDELRPELDDLCRRLIDLGVLRPAATVSTMWDDLTSSSAAERLDDAGKMAAIAQAMANAAPGSQPVFTVNEVRVTAGLDPIPGGDGDDPLDDDDDDLDDE